MITRESPAALTRVLEKDREQYRLAAVGRYNTSNSQVP